MSKQRLYCFDLDGTLISSYMETQSRNINDWTLLPGRTEALKELRQQGHRVAIVTNQGGVAFGHTTEVEVIEKLSQVLHALGFGGHYEGIDERHILFGHNDDNISYFGRAPTSHWNAERNTMQPWMTIHVSYFHPRATELPYANIAEAGRRKPSPAMILEAQRIHGIPTERTVFVGDMDTDREAAEHAGVAYRDVEEFFSAA